MGNIHQLNSQDVEYRMVSREGTINISAVGIPGKKRRYVSDLFTTLVELQWEWNIVIFIGTVFTTWLVFAVYYWLVCEFHGDFRDQASSSSDTLCLTNVRTFTATYLFSIETQSTIGYGFRYVTEECPAAFIGVFLQSVIGAGLQAILAGIAVAKIRRPLKRFETVQFSKAVCINELDGKLRLTFRIGDIRKSLIIEAHARGVLVKKRTTKVGTNFPVQYYHMPLQTEGGHENIFMAWPNIMTHIIDEDSPFWKISECDIYRESFELIIILEGIVSSTGQPVQMKTSYLQTDMIWGHRFLTLGGCKDWFGRNIINYENFDSTYPVPTPSCSAEKFQNENVLERESLIEDPEQDTLDTPAVYLTPKSHTLPTRRYSIMDTYLGTDDIEETLDQ